MTAETFLILWTVHFVGDFVLQSHWMSVQKSRRMDALLLHTAIYAICFLYWGGRFVVVTWLLHTATDYVTSRVNARLWYRHATGSLPTLHWFFVGIGFDQLLHAAMLYGTYRWVFRV